MQDLLNTLHAFFVALQETIKLVDIDNLLNFTNWNTDVANPPTVTLNILYALQCVRLYWFTIERGWKTRLLFASVITTSLFMGIIRAFLPHLLPLADWLFWSLLNGAVAVSNSYLQERRPRITENLEVYTKAAHWQWYLIIGGFGILSLYCMSLYGQRNTAEQSSDRKALQASTKVTADYNKIEEGRHAFRDTMVAILQRQGAVIQQQSRTISQLTLLAKQRAEQIEKLTKTASKTSKDVTAIKGAVTHEPATDPVERLSPKLPAVSKPTSTTGTEKKQEKKGGGWLPWKWFSQKDAPLPPNASSYKLDSLYAEGSSNH